MPSLDIYLATFLSLLVWFILSKMAKGLRVLLHWKCGSNVFPSILLQYLLMLMMCICKLFFIHQLSIYIKIRNLKPLDGVSLSVVLFVLLSIINWEKIPMRKGLPMNYVSLRAMVPWSMTLLQFQWFHGLHCGSGIEACVRQKNLNF